MPIFMVERNYAELLEPNADDTERINAINDEEGVVWLVSFLTADKRRTYCLYEAESIDAILRAAERAGIPADAVVEVTHRVWPDASLTGVI